MSQIKNEENTVKNFIELEKNELKQVDGGLLAGALAGAINCPLCQGHFELV